jgi:hypothetical protein
MNCTLEKKLGNKAQKGMGFIVSFMNIYNQ